MNSRLNKLKTLLSEKNLDAALISSVPNIVYLTNFAHFSTHEREAFLIITQNKNYVITDKRYSHAVRKGMEDFELLELSADHPLKHWLGEIFVNEHVKKLGIETNNLTVHEWEKIKPLIKESKHFDLSPLRMIKDREEITKIKKACTLGDQAFKHIQNHIREGMTEKEVAFELEHFIRKNGADVSFSTIIAFEENAAIPHHKTGNSKLKTGNLILLDFGVQYENYCSDMTRTICFGPATEEKKKIHQTVKEAQQKAIDYIKENRHAELVSASNATTDDYEILKQVQDDKKTMASETDKTAREYIISKGYPSIPHSLGHGIGLEVHESPSLSPKSKDELKEGMVFSIEPGIYLNDNCGVRIEDLFTIQNGNLLQLTQSPKELIEI
jgi:Xaa-Pro aminopeptidase